MKYRVHFASLAISGLFLFLDQILKLVARDNPDFTFYLFSKWLGWEYYTNTGIAFSLPFPNWLMIVLTPLVILGLFVFATKQKSPSKLFILAIYFIIFGAISNLADRILFGHTIDYVRFFSSIINLADIIILSGAVILLIEEYKKTSA